MTKFKDRQCSVISQDKTELYSQKDTLILFSSKAYFRDKVATNYLTV